MLDERLRSYIMGLPFAPQGLPAIPQEDDQSGLLDLSNLPDTFLAGSNLVEFAPGTTATLKAGIALCLLAAQRISQEDPVVATPEQWIERQNTVLANLNWRLGKSIALKRQFKKADEAVTEAIEPFLEEAFTGVPGGGATIRSALQNIRETAKHRPWFAIFDRESNRVNVTEYQFSAIAIQNQDVRMKLASARFDASFGRTQVLFFHKTKESASFDGVSQELFADTEVVSAMQDTLRVKFGSLSQAFIRRLDVQ